MQIGLTTSVVGGGGPKPLLLSRRYNLFTYSEQMAHADWQANTLSFSNDAVAAPDGTTTADLVYPTSSGTNRRFQRGAVSATAATYTWSIFAKYSGIPFLYVFQNNGAGYGAFFNVQTGQVGTVASGYTGAMTSLGNGWYKLVMTTPSLAPTFLGYIGLANADNNEAVTASGSNGMYLWGAQVMPSADYAAIGGRYQRITDAATFASIGYPP